MTLHSEITEQPERIKSLLFSQRKTVERIAAEIQKRDIHYVFLSARGTSDNAGRYANYLWGAFNGLPVALAAPSLFTLYQKPPRLRNALVVGISQSGQSPDIVSVLEEGRRQNCLTLAITNQPDSPLARQADFTFDILAGDEKAVAATKTYTSELMALAMLSAALKHDPLLWSELETIPALAQQTLNQTDVIHTLAQRYRYMRQCVVLGRGFNYATAFEWALKLKELAYVEAEPYSSADFHHGPMALVEPGFPVLAVAPQGQVFESMLEALLQLKRAGAELVILSNDARALTLAQTALPLPAMPEWLSPLVSILPAQVFARELTLAKELDTETPRSIRKVTETL